MATKTFKIGLSATDKTNMAQDIREEIEKMLFDAYSSSSTYKVGDYVVYNDTLYRCTTAVESAESFDNTKWTQATLQDLVDDVNGAVASVNNKANVDGYYETLTSGNALQLVSKTYLYDQTAYNFRTSGGDNDIGNQSRLEKLVGGTINFNQLFLATASTTTSNGITFTNNGDGSWTLSGTASSNARLTIATISKSELNNKKVLWGFSNLTTAISGVKIQERNHAINTQLMSIRGLILSYDTIFDILVESGTDLTTPIKVIPQMFDLTAMFGSTVANWLYQKEQNEAGAGVAWFKNLFPLPYYAYQTPVLLSTKASKKTNVGFNAWDEKTQVYYGSNLGSKNHIVIIPNTTYYFRITSLGVNTITLYYYDKDKNEIGNATITGGNTTFTTPSNAFYLKFILSSAYGTTYNHDICINISWSGYRNGEYEPYKEYEYDLPNQVLRGIPKLDEKGNLYFDGDYIEPDGTLHKRFEKVDLSTIINTKNGTGTNVWRTSSALSLAKAPSSNGIVANIFCGLYENKSYTDVVTNDTDMSICIGENGYVYIQNKNGFGETAQEVQTTLSGVYLVYELASEEISTVSEYTEVQVVDDFGTEDYTCVGYNESTEADTTISIPCGNYTRYANNLRDKLQRLPDMPDDTGYYVVYYNETPDFANGENFCTFYNLPTWLSDNGYGNITGFKENMGCTLRQLLVSNVVAGGGTLDFDDTMFVDLGNLTWTYVGGNYTAYSTSISSLVNIPSTYSVKAIALCSKYNIYAEDSFTSHDLSYAITSVNGNILIKDSSLGTSGSQVKKSLKGILLAFKKASS